VLILMILVGLAGGVALSWELLWHLQASLALGVSAKGAAIILAATMGGMCAGSFIAGNALRSRPPVNPLRLYGVLELVIGLCGLAMLPGFRALMALDGRLFRCCPALSAPLHLAGIVLLLGPPTIAMGATIPLFGLIAARFRTSLSRLYAMNTAGAAAGVLLVSFFVMPHLGVRLSVQLLTVLNLLVCFGATRLACPRMRDAQNGPAGPVPAQGAEPSGILVPGVLVFCTGLATFALEVAWFRSLRAAFQQTTDSFAIVLATVLIAIALGARLAKRLARTRLEVAHVLACASVAILLATPLIERFDLLGAAADSYWRTMLLWSGCSLLVMGVPMLLLATVFPSLLDAQHTPQRWGLLNGLSTLGAILGSLLAAWVMLPAVGFARSSWLVAGLLALPALILCRGRARPIAAAACMLGLLVAVSTESGLGRDRIQGEKGRPPYRLLSYSEGPDSTTSVVEFEGGWRALIIDGFMAAAEGKTSLYMEWMGRLPMLLHPNPERALVIAFGTGQTANGVRREGPDALDVVELNPAVIEMAGFFDVNENVLGDPRVETIVMDGRAWLRRTDRLYDIVTLEPMPPHFAGVNALYSLEFYQLMATRLRPGAIVAQWVPYHLLPPEYAISVSATFRAVFPNALLWVDPFGGTGIILGRYQGSHEPLGRNWPGLGRTGSRALGGQAIRSAVRLDPQQLVRYTEYMPVVTDDNQLLAYGDIRRKQHANIAQTNLRLIEMIRSQPAPAGPAGLKR